MKFFTLLTIAAAATCAVAHNHHDEDDDQHLGHILKGKHCLFSTKNEIARAYFCKNTDAIHLLYLVF
jgi:hypothetical protein